MEWLRRLWPGRIGNSQSEPRASARYNFAPALPGLRAEISAARPLFVIGAPRSGTTLLARILNPHPGVLLTNETAVFLQLHDNIVKSRQGARVGLLYGKEYHELWADYLNEQARTLIEGYYERIRQLEGKRELAYWGEKHPHHHECLAFLSSLYPEARYIYIVRDPRDAALSIAALGSYDFATALRGVRLALSRYEPFAAECGPERCYRLRYRDLVADYEGVSAGMFGWLGLDLASAVRGYLARYRDVDAHAIPTGGAPHMDFLDTSVGRWRRALSPEDRAYAAEILGDFLDRYGYSR